MRKVPRRGWQQLSAGAGAKGPRRYDWAAVDPIPTHSAGTCQLLIRRNRTTGQVAYYHCFSPRPVALPTLVRVAGTSWKIEETFQAGKGLAGLDEHQVRRHTPWLRWVTLAMLAHAFLAVIRAGEHHEHPAPTGLVALTCNEIQRLFALPAASRTTNATIACTGPYGVVDTRPAPATATTADARPQHEDPQLRMEY